MPERSAERIEPDLHGAGFDSISVRRPATAYGEKGSGRRSNPKTERAVPLMIHSTSASESSGRSWAALPNAVGYPSRASTFGQFQAHIKRRSPLLIVRQQT